MKAIILAAGRGTRMGAYGADLPKGMLSFCGQPLLRRQIDTLRGAGIDSIYVVTGFGKSCIDFSDVEYFHNAAYAETNMVESLMCARSILEGGCLVTYADILFSSSLVRMLTHAKGDIVVAVDEAWKDYWQLRYGTTEHDLESLTVSPEGHITDLGKPVDSSEDLKYRYIGMVMFSPEGIKRTLKIYDEKRAEGHGWPQSGNSFEQGYMTDLLDEVIRKGLRVMPGITRNGWLEFDTAQDYETMSALREAGTLSRLIDLKENRAEHE
jgi:choline kinase